jgi:hypothetical protein
MEGKIINNKESIIEYLESKDYEWIKKCFFK